MVTQYYTGSSIDGFIADPDHSLSWLVTRDIAGDGPQNYDAFYAGIGALCMGASTYQWLLDNAPGDWAYRIPAWVFTHRSDLPEVRGTRVSFVSGDVRPVYDEIAAALPGKDIWVVGGGDLVGQFDDAGLLDEVHVHLTPVVLGTGAPLLPRRITSSRMRFRECRRTGQRVNVVLDIDRRSSL